MALSPIAQFRFWLQKTIGFDSSCGHAFYAHPLNGDSVVIDLGANKGDFSGYLSSRYGCWCHAVEASPDLFRSLPSDPLVSKYNFAISGVDEPVKFYPNADSEAGAIGASPATDAVAITVEGKKLESFLKSISTKEVDLLKMDIEGAEIAVFESTSDATLRSIKQITIEFHDFLMDGRVTAADVALIRKRLKSVGFASTKLSNSNMDYLFINRKYFRKPLLFAFCRGVNWFYRLRALCRTPSRMRPVCVQNGHVRADRK